MLRLTELPSQRDSTRNSIAAASVHRQSDNHRGPLVPKIPDRENRSDSGGENQANAGARKPAARTKSSEYNLRNLYRRWAEFMEADSWDALATWRHPSLAEAAK
jgi:hypothetical protein